MTAVLSNTKIIPSHRQGPNLKKLLTNSSFKNQDTIKIVSKCNDTICATCPNLLEGSEFTFPESNRIVKPKCNLSCDSSNILYALKCQGCHKTYIGEAGDTLRHRLTVHRQHVREGNTAPLHLSRHISNCQRGSDFIVFPFYQCFSDKVRLGLFK